MDDTVRARRYGLVGWSGKVFIRRHRLTEPRSENGENFYYVKHRIPDMVVYGESQSPNARLLTDTDTKATWWSRGRLGFGAIQIWI